MGAGGQDPCLLALPYLGSTDGGSQSGLAPLWKSRWTGHTCRSSAPGPKTGKSGCSSNAGETSSGCSEYMGEEAVHVQTPEWLLAD